LRCYWLDSNILSVIVEILFADALELDFWCRKFSFSGFVQAWKLGSILPNTATLYEILPNTAEYCQFVWNTAKYCRILPNCMKYCQFSYKYCQIVKYIKINNYSNEIYVLEDRTWIDECIEYDKNKDSLLGLVSPFDDKTGPPLIHYFKAGYAN
jgi:hypothetical protein